MFNLFVDKDYIPIIKIKKKYFFIIIDICFDKFYMIYRLNICIFFIF